MVEWGEQMEKGTDERMMMIGRRMEAVVAEVENGGRTTPHRHHFDGGKMRKRWREIDEYRKSKREKET